MLRKSNFKKSRNQLEGFSPNLQTDKPYVPQELCTSCPSCKAMLFQNDLEENNGVCPKCGYHFRGLCSLIRMAGLEYKKLSAEMVAYTLIPRINATGRMGNPSRAVHLLITEDEQQAEELAEEICQENEQRKETESGIFEAALCQLRENPQRVLDRVLVIDGENWHPGENPNFLCRQKATEEGEEGKASYIIGEPLWAASLRYALEREFGMKNLHILTPLEGETSLLRKGDLAEAEEDDCFASFQKAEYVFGDPLYEWAISRDSGAKLIRLPHEGCSGRMLQSHTQRPWILSVFRDWILSSMVGCSRCSRQSHT